MTPAALLAAMAAALSFLIQRGGTPVPQWVGRLRFPLVPTLFGTIGTFTIEFYLETNTSLDAVLRYGSGLPDWVLSAGEASVALAVITLATRRLLPRVLVGIAAVFVVFIAYDYNNLALVVGALVLAILIWWGLRLRPPATPSATPAPNAGPTAHATPAPSDAGHEQPVAQP
jgi:hypothetical protein